MKCATNLYGTSMDDSIVLRQSNAFEAEVRVSKLYATRLCRALGKQLHGFHHAGVDRMPLSQILNAIQAGNARFR